MSSGAKRSMTEDCWQSSGHASHTDTIGEKILTHTAGDATLLGAMEAVLNDSSPA